MWSQTYKGFIIQGYCDKDECTIAGYKFKSLLAAKQGISKWINKGYPLPKYVL
jgi:hypothetical protein